MPLLKLHHHHLQFLKIPKLFPISKTIPLQHSNFLLNPIYNPKLPLNSLSNVNCKIVQCVSSAKVPKWMRREEDERDNFELEYLAPDGEVYQKTLRLVECAMFSAVSGLTYLLSNSLAIENYFGCFFALPIVLSSMRWGVSAARKTMVGTFVLLFVLSGPVKALTYLLMHGLLGFAMGSMWRSKASWGISIFCCAVVRAMGAIGYVLISSFLIEENILALITVNIHASLTYVFTSVGLQSAPSMDIIYAIFGSLLLVNCTFFVFLLHLLYAVFFTKFGMKSSLRLPRWLETAI
ncbi:uncharacterized protein LOC113751316 isoform X1 [Coffea eugenioides]|uniref:uncharacterized protein LOC113751316 isoform X1 n=2 Tax=Coffea eugenioides TaxID=49369 RepID=UPI000F60A7B0|nr:uncharacterized protein LOC113751316 isoform X1 [Coffea eugenioides]